MAVVQDAIPLVVAAVGVDVTGLVRTVAMDANIPAKGHVKIHALAHVVIQAGSS